jgi:hypothetical protein
VNRLESKRPRRSADSGTGNPSHNGGGTLPLRLAKAEKSEPFPPESLWKYFTPEKNKEELALLSGCSLEHEYQGRAICAAEPDRQIGLEILGISTYRGTDNPCSRMA